MAESLLLKWGTVKGWDDLTEQSSAIMQRFFAAGFPMSCAMDKPDNARKAILCELIDQFDGMIREPMNAEIAERLSAIRKAMAAALREKPKNLPEFHRLGAEHRAILHAANPATKAEWERCREATR